MNTSNLQNEILSILDEDKIGTLATVVDNKPQSRFMSFYHEHFTLYTPTDLETHKVESIKKNPAVHILIGYTGEGLHDSYLEIEGQAELITDSTEKQKWWQDKWTQWFEGPTDPKYVLLKITPSIFRLMNIGEETPKTLEL